jgi:probable rRNA maturation factor
VVLRAIFLAGQNLVAIRGCGAREFRALVTLEKAVTGLTEAALRRFVARASRASGLRGTVNLLVTSNARMRSLNRRFRGKDKPTDVLSFPAVATVRSATKSLAGDIAISASIAAMNARLLGHSSADEIKILVLHGVLHLRGYDHERDHGRMARREHALRKKLKLPDGLIERAAAKKERPKASVVTPNSAVRVPARARRRA